MCIYGCDGGCNVTNRAEIYGRVTEAPQLSHSIYGDAFYSFTIESVRSSGRCDRIPCMTSERNLRCILLNRPMVYCGQIRSYNKIVDGINRLDIRLFVRDIFADAEDDSLNRIRLTGYICKEPVYRRTPFGREITDLLLAVNRPYNKSDYIPIITWGRNARLVKLLSVGEQLTVEGRLQSRDYEKLLPDGTRLCRTAYELSVRELELGD